MRALALAFSLALACLALAGGGAARPGAIGFKGTAKIKSFDVTKHCGAKSVNSKLLRVRCVRSGTYAGDPAPANVNLGWTWDLPVNAAGHTTGPATEHATLIFNFGGAGLLYLSLVGKQTIVGEVTATKATAITRGTWKVTKGTAAFLGRHGKGTYTFKTGRTNSESVFSVAELKLSGSLT
jgi:hypothetical protein